jgi:hypothetical protein
VRSLDIDGFYIKHNDLNNPNRQVVVGDTYGYNYKYAAITLDAFTLNSATIKLIFI